MSNYYSTIFEIIALEGRFIFAHSSVLIKYKQSSNKSRSIKDTEWELIIFEYESKLSVNVILPKHFHVEVSGSKFRLLINLKTFMGSIILLHQTNNMIDAYSRLMIKAHISLLLYVI
ncbi:hypothetical protein RF11_12219 [Thelohanellus kitauei]|uniref:Uncharacterized protein n=1 Tax=Thelohanellus kitauei TaxID=669202 RepID=A0A0C2JW53_THEKT|nr:hypothetical protein RF11_12219 [Thelohanellus kitauei]